MIHDSYGTTAADSPALSACLRSTFACIYEGDPLAALEAELRGQLAHPPRDLRRPGYGTWEPGSVRESAFFFH